MCQPCCTLLLGAPLEHIAERPCCGGAGSSATAASCTALQLGRHQPVRFRGANALVSRATEPQSTPAFGRQGMPRSDQDPLSPRHGLVRRLAAGDTRARVRRAPLPSRRHARRPLGPARMELVTHYRADGLPRLLALRRPALSTLVVHRLIQPARLRSRLFVLPPLCFSSRCAFSVHLPSYPLLTLGHLPATEQNHCRLARQTPSLASLTALFAAALFFSQPVGTTLSTSLHLLRS